MMIATGCRKYWLGAVLTGQTLWVLRDVRVAIALSPYQKASRWCGSCGPWIFDDPVAAAATCRATGLVQADQRCGVKQQHGKKCWMLCMCTGVCVMGL